MPTASNSLTPERLAAMKAAQGRIAPFLPPDMARAIWIARLNGDYDPPAGKYAIPALGLYPRDEQPGFPGGHTPGTTGNQGGFGYRTVATQPIQPARNPLSGLNPMPDTSGPLESPFVRAALNSLAPSDQQRAANHTSATTPDVYPDDGRSSSGLYGGVLTPVARVPTPGTHTEDHHPDSVQGSGIPRYETHPEWSKYDRIELPDSLGAIGFWSTKQDGWEYSVDGGQTWHPVPVEGKDLPIQGTPNDNDNPRSVIFRGATGV